MKKYSFIATILFIVLLLFYYSAHKENSNNNSTVLHAFTDTKPSLKIGKVLYINSYHIGYEWSDGIYNSLLHSFKIKQGFSGELDLSESIVDFKVFEMDTKRNPSDSSINNSVEKVRALIDSWKPDVVIASDDNASKYIIAPYYKDSPIPFIFCGINWSVEEYGYPYTNVTGMISVHLIDQMINNLKEYAKGDRIGFIRGDNLTSRKDAEIYERYFGIKLDKRFVKDFDEWKREYSKLQTEVDMILVGNASSIKNWDPEEALKVVNKYTEIPTATKDIWMRHYALFTIANSSTEQGEWCANTAIDILHGKPISSIKVTTNKKSAKHINMKLAKKLHIKFPIDELENANIINSERAKILYINSYHKGYTWSDGIESGLLKALNLQEDSGKVDLYNELLHLKIVRMDTKLHNDEHSILKSSQATRDTINLWEPDIIVTSDDIAFKHVIKPYFFDSKIPILYCGINWDDSIYGLPKSGIRGMVEFEPIIEAIELMSNYYKCDNIGYLGSSTFSDKKAIEYTQKYAKVKFSRGTFTKTFEQWKHNFKIMQDSVDCIYLFNNVGIENWDENEAKKFIFENSKVPTFTCVKGAMNLCVLGVVKIPEEQGWWIGNAAKKVLLGTEINYINSTKNRNNSVYINMTLANKLHIKFPVELLKKSTIVR